MNKKVLLYLTTFLLLAQPCLAATVTLRWDPTPGTDFVGYRLYRSTTSGLHTKGAYIAEVPAGTEIYVVNNFPAGTYYWRITVYDAEGNESNFSSEVSTTILARPGQPGTPGTGR